MGVEEDDLGIDFLEEEKPRHEEKKEHHAKSSSGLKVIYDEEEKPHAHQGWQKQNEEKTSHPAPFSYEPEQPSFWKRAGVWRFIAVLFLALLLISLFTSGFNLLNNGKGKTESVLPLDQAGKQAVSFLNSNVLPPTVTASLVNTQEVSGIYLLKLDVGGQQFDSYVTKDGKLFFAEGIDLTTPFPAAQNGREELAAAPTVQVSEDDDPFLGEADAPVTIIEFSDYQCPFCRKFWRETHSELVRQYIDTGKAKLVFRDLPLESIHPAARPAALAAECAGDQDQYFEFHDKLFAEQDKKGAGTVQFGAADLKQWAQEIGLDIKEFNSCFDSKKYDGEIDKDIADATSVGVTGTPSFFINGRALSGAQPFSAFKAIIEQELAEAKKQPATNEPTAGEEVDSGVTAAATTPTAGEKEGTSTAAPGEKVFAITAKKYRFEPHELVVDVGTKVTVKLTSLDAEHSFRLTDFGVDLVVPAGQTKEITFSADRKGEFIFTSKADPVKMKGVLVVK